MSNEIIENPFGNLKRLIVLPQFLDKKERESKKLQGYILDKSLNEVRLKTENIQWIIEDSPYEPYQKSFHIYFFDSILGENTIMKNAKHLFAPNEEVTHWQYGGYYDHINTFLLTYTNIAVIAKEFLEIVRNLPEKRIIITTDPKLANLYYFYFRYLLTKGYTQKEIPKKFVLFDGCTLVIEPDVSVREIQLNYKWIIMLHPNLNKWINPVFRRDVDEMCEHYSDKKDTDIKCL